MKRQGNLWIVKTSGLGKDLIFYPDASTGQIRHGIGLAPIGEGGFVISYEDIKQMYELATKERNTK